MNCNVVDFNHVEMHFRFTKAQCLKLTDCYYSKQLMFNTVDILFFSLIRRV